MKMGTRSVLLGAHQFLIHPLMVAWGWYRLYGFQVVEDPYVGRVSITSPALWFAFFIHDLGYLGCENMDDESGELHPLVGASVMWVFSWGDNWGWFVLYHSRFFAQKDGMEPSFLCYADKMSTALEPWWLYLPRVKLTGEIHEYFALAQDQTSKYQGEIEPPKTHREWFERIQSYLKNYAEVNRYGTS